MSADGLLLFGIDRGVGVARTVAERLGVELAPYELRVFPDTEMKIRPLVSVRRRDVFVVGSVVASGPESVNDALCRLLFFAGSLRDAGATRVTAVIPYLGYARKDRRTKARDPLTTRYIAELVEAMGIERVAAMEVHNEAAFANAFRCQAEHLESARLMASHLAPEVAGDDVTVLSPDIGGVNRADRFRRALGRTLHVMPAFGFMEKRRSDDHVTGDAVIGQFEGRTVVIVDDLISSGHTIARAAEACKERYAKRVIVAAAHGLFARGSGETLGRAPVDRILVTNSVALDPLTAAALADKLAVVDAAPLLAHAIEAMHAGGSITETRTP